MNGRNLGGKLLRLMREQRKLSQLDVELSRVTSLKSLSRIETGKTERPQRETLDTLLAFYEATFNEAQDVLKSFGYLPEYPLPSGEEVAVVMAQVQPALDAAPVPAYCVDYIARLHGFNGLFVRLSGLDQAAVAQLEGLPIWQALYKEQMDADAPLDPQLFGEIRQLRQRMAIYVGEPWFDDFIADLGETFLAYWHAAGEVTETEQLHVMPFAARLLSPVTFTVPDIEHGLSFYANAEIHSMDDRFRVIYLLAADVPTMQWLAAQKR